ncbi:chromosomal replication initiator protein DnaA, partial [Kitasatospora sp. NPDC004240]
MADVNSDLVPVWTRVVERLVSDPDVGEMDKQWVQRTQPMWMMHDTALLATPNERAKQVLEGRLLPQLTDALSRELNRPVRIAVMVDANAVPTMPGPVPAEPPAPEPYPAVEPYPGDHQGGDYGRQAYERPYEPDYGRERYDDGYEQRPAPPYGGPGRPPAWEGRPAYPEPGPGYGEPSYGDPHQGYPEPDPGYEPEEPPTPARPRPLPGPSATTQGDLFGGAYGPGPGERRGPRRGGGAVRGAGGRPGTPR